MNSGLSNELCRLLPHLLGQHEALAILIYLLQCFFIHVWSLLFSLFIAVVASNCIFVAVASLCRSMCVVHRNIA